MAVPFAPSQLVHNELAFWETRFFKTNDNNVVPLPVHYLAERVPLFHDLFSLPQPIENDEGLTAEKPIDLPMISTPELAAITDRLFARPDKLAGNFAASELLLSAADKWSCDEAKSYAVAMLPRCQEWSAVQELRLAVSYRQREWLLEAFRELVWRKASSFTLEERLMLGHEVLRKLDAARDAVETHRLQLVCSSLPFSPSPHCFKPDDQCETVYNQAWTEAGPRLLCDPSHAVRGPLVLSKLEPLLSDLVDLCGACQTKSVSQLRTLGAFDKEDLIIAEHVAHLGL